MSGNREVALIQSLGVPRETVRQRFSEILPGHRLSWRGGSDAEGKTLTGLVGSAEYLVTGSLPIDGVTIRNCSLAMISVSFTGYDHVDLAACRERGIAVYNTPGYSTDSVAELAVGLTLSLLRNIPNAVAHARAPAGSWFAFPDGAELRGRTVGIVGTGAAGMAAARLFAAFGCGLRGYSRNHNNGFKQLGGTYRSLEEVLRESDILSLHLALGPETRHIINAERLALLKPESVLINTARGGLVDGAALAAALNEKRLAGAGLDVFEHEPPKPDDPLLNAPNTVLTPHIGYKTRQALLRKVDITFRNIADFESGVETNRVA